MDGGGGCDARLVVGVVVLMVVVVVVVLVVVVVVLVVVVVVGVVVVVLLVVVVAVLVFGCRGRGLAGGRCGRTRVVACLLSRCASVAVVSVCGVGREPLSTVESGGGRGLWC